MAVSKKQMRWLTATACSAESLRIGDTNKLYSFLKKRQPNFLAISLSLSLSLLNYLQRFSSSLSPCLVTGISY